MEDGLITKIFKHITVATIVFVSFFILDGCESEETIPVQTAEIVLYSSLRDESCVFKINSDGTVDFARGGYVWEKKNYLEQKSKKLSNFQRRRINELITKIKENDRIVDGTMGLGGDVIYATIDNVEYQSMFGKLVDNGATKTNVNPELVDLTAELIEIAPVKLKHLKRYVRNYIWE